MARSVRLKMEPSFGRPLAELAGVGDMTRELAERCADAANGMLDKDDGYIAQGFEVKPMEGNGYVVRTKTDHARHSQAKNKTLTKAFHSI